MKLDINGINNKVKPPLNYSIKDLDSSIGIISSISIPGDFAYSGVLRNCTKTINNTKQKINSIYKWANNVTMKFQQAEQKNANILNAIVGTIAKTDMAKAAAKVSSTISIGNKIGTNPKILNIVMSAKKAFDTGAKIVTDKCKSIYRNTIESIKLTKAKMVTKAEAIINKMEKAVTKKVNQIKKLTTNALTGINLVGTKVVDKCENFYKAEIEPRLEKAVECMKAVFADVSNVVLSVTKGLGQFMESIVDLAKILDTMQHTISTGITDGVTYLLSKATGTTDEWESKTAKMWKDTMSFVAEDHVGNAFESFYKNTVAGQWLDEHAHECFKSDGIVSEIASGIGYIGGIVVLSIPTLGVGGVAVGAGGAATMTTTTSVIAGLSGTGKYTAEYWEKARDSSWEGIEERYKSGEISEEQYRSFQEIRNLSDEEWEEFTAEYEKGNISKADYEMIKQIREIPEDWTTFENGAKGLGYGAANGAWEGVQWYAGGKLGSWTMKSGSKLATSAVRIGADTGFNALDTPYRTTIDAITSNQSWKEAWESQGGWISVLTSVGIGLLGSIGGEAIDFRKTKNIDVGNESVIDNVIDSNKSIEHSIKNTKKTLKDFDNEIAQANYYTSKGNFYGIKVDSLDDIPKELFEKIDDPSNVYFLVNGERVSFIDAQYPNRIGKAAKNTNVEVKDFDIEPDINTKQNLLEIEKEIKKIDKKLSNKKLYEDVEESLKNQICSNLKNKHLNGQIDLNNLSKSELRQYVNQEAVNVKNNLNSIIKNSDFNKKNLIEGIADTIPRDLDDLTKARMVYLKLNQSVSYSDQYFAMNNFKDLYENQLSEMYYRNFDISNMQTNSVICSNWSAIYKDLLEEVGIDSNKIEVISVSNKTGAHKWIKMNLEDGKVLFADATNNINGLTDLANVKLENPTAGFIITTLEEYKTLKEMYRNDINTFRVINSKNGEQLAKIDEVIGYSHQQYMKDFDSITNIYKQDSSTVISSNDKINIFRDLVDDKQYSALDVFSIARNYASNVLGLDTQVNLFIKEDKAITVIETVLEDNKLIYLYKINDSNIQITDNITSIIEGAKKRA